MPSSAINAFQLPGTTSLWSPRTLGKPLYRVRTLPRSRHGASNERIHGGAPCPSVRSKQSHIGRNDLPRSAARVVAQVPIVARPQRRQQRVRRTERETRGIVPVAQIGGEVAAV